MTFNFDKNQERTLYNFTKQENTEVKSCCDFRIKRNNRKRDTLSIKSQRRFARDRKASFFCYPARQGGFEGEMKQEMGNGISGRAPHLAGDGHQRRTVRIGVREAHHKKARSSNAWCFFFLTCAAGCFIIRMISDVCGAVRPAVKLRQAKKGTAMREE